MPIISQGLIKKETTKLNKIQKIVHFHRPIYRYNYIENPIGFYFDDKRRIVRYPDKRY